MSATKTKDYRVWPKASDPTLEIRLPGRVLKDLVNRATENGRSVEVELALRLARSLEQDAERDETKQKDDKS